MNSIDEVEIWDGENWIRKGNRDSVESSIMEENEKRFRLTENTPLMQMEIIKYIGYLEDRPDVDEILEGNIIGMEYLSREVNDFFRIFKSQGSGRIDTGISAEDFKSYWSGSKEQTS